MQRGKKTSSYSQQYLRFEDNFCFDFYFICQNIFFKFSFCKQYSFIFPFVCKINNFVFILIFLYEDIIKVGYNSQSRRDLNQFASHVSSPEKKDPFDSDPTQNAISSATPRRRLDIRPSLLASHRCEYQLTTFEAALNDRRRRKTRTLASIPVSSIFKNIISIN